MTARQNILVMKQTDPSSVSGAFSWETTHRRQFSMGKMSNQKYIFVHYHNENRPKE